MSIEKNAKIAATRRATVSRHSRMQPVTRELKITENRLTRDQKASLRLAFLEAKWIYNHLVTRSEGWREWDPASKTVPVRLPDGSYEDRELHLGSQVKQKLQAKIGDSLKTLATLKAQGRKVGALRPKRSVGSLPLSQPGTTYRFDARQRRVKIQGLPGWLPFRGDSLEGLELASARLVQRARGYYLLVTGYREPQARETNGRTVGLDFGVKTHITTSEGVEYNALFGETERLKWLQRKLQRQVKGSANRAKTQQLLRREYEKLDRRKADRANKIVHELLENDLVVIQDDNLRGWKTRYGKRLQHSILGRVKAKLVASPRVIVLDRYAPSTQLCPNCGSLNPQDLSERTYSCDCGYAAPRDQHAAQNMLLLAASSEWEKKSPAGRRVAPVENSTPGGSFAASKSSSVKQETVLPRKVATGETVSSSVAP